MPSIFPINTPHWKEESNFSDNKVNSGRFPFKDDHQKKDGGQKVDETGDSGLRHRPRVQRYLRLHVVHIPATILPRGRRMFIGQRL